MLFAVALFTIAGLSNFVTPQQLDCFDCVADPTRHWCYNDGYSRLLRCRVGRQFCSGRKTRDCSGLYEEEEQPYEFNPLLTSCFDCLYLDLNYCRLQIDDKVMQFCVDPLKTAEYCTGAPIYGSVYTGSCVSTRDPQFPFIPVSPVTLPNTCNACVSADPKSSYSWCVSTKLKARVCVKSQTFDFQCPGEKPITDCKQIPPEKQTELFPRPPFYLNVKTCKQCKENWNGKWCVTNLYNQAVRFCMPKESPGSYCLAGNVKTDCEALQTEESNFQFPDLPDNCNDCNKDKSRRWFMSTILNVKTRLCLPDQLGKLLKKFGTTTYHCSIYSEEKTKIEGIFNKNINPINPITTATSE